MSTIEEFKNAPVGATATNQDGEKAIKTLSRSMGNNLWLSEYMSFWKPIDLKREGYVLDPAPAVPASAREALDLAWELAHPVKIGETIPDSAHYLRRWTDDVPPTTHSAHGHIDVMTEKHTATVRTLDPIPDPDPEPDWLDAPAVLAYVKGRVGDPQVFARENKTGTQWLRDTKVYRWDELTVVVPLYPKGQEA